MPESIESYGFIHGYILAILSGCAIDIRRHLISNTDTSALRDTAKRIVANDVKKQLSTTLGNGDFWIKNGATWTVFVPTEGKLTFATCGNRKLLAKRLRMCIFPAP